MHAYTHVCVSLCMLLGRKEKAEQEEDKERDENSPRAQAPEEEACFMQFLARHPN